MGICPYARDHDGLQLPPAPTAVEPLKLSGERGSSPALLQVTLRSSETIIRLVGPLQDRYRIGDTLKAEDAVEVLRAQYIASGQDCIITKIKKTVYKDPKAVKAAIFSRVMRLDHPRLLKTYEVCQDGMFLYIVSEPWLTSLSDYITEVGRMPQAHAATAVYQLWSALAYCHENCVVHRSVNLQSIVLKTQPTDGVFDLRLTDLHHVSSALQSDTPSMFSPPDGEFSERSDIWSSGVVLYVLLSGRNPFQRFRYGSPIKYKGFSFPPAVWDSVSQDAVKLIMTLLSQRPADRPTALECLAHPWVQRFATVRPLNSQPVRKSLRLMRRRQTYQSLKEAVMQFIINRVMKDSEIAHLAENFCAIDINGDGQISREEFMRSLKTVMSHEQAVHETETVFAKIDRNRNGMIDYTEFLVSAFEERKLLNRGSLKAAFATLDRDGNGRISIQELKHFFRVNSSAGSFDQWRALIAEFDTSGDGEIDFGEFEAMMTAAFRQSPHHSY